MAVAAHTYRVCQRPPAAPKPAGLAKSKLFIRLCLRNDFHLKTCSFLPFRHHASDAALRPTYGRTSGASSHENAFIVKPVSERKVFPCRTSPNVVRLP